MSQECRGCTPVWFRLLQHATLLCSEQVPQPCLGRPGAAVDREIRPEAPPAAAADSPGASQRRAEEQADWAVCVPDRGFHEACRPYFGHVQEFGGGRLHTPDDCSAGRADDAPHGARVHFQRNLARQLGL